MEMIRQSVKRWLAPHGQEHAKRVTAQRMQEAFWAYQRDPSAHHWNRLRITMEAYQEACYPSLV